MPPKNYGLNPHGGKEITPRLGRRGRMVPYGRGAALVVIMAFFRGDWS